jgi:hypothetical protein
LDTIAADCSAAAIAEMQLTNVRLDELSAVKGNGGRS